MTRPDPSQSGQPSPPEPRSDDLGPVQGGAPRPARSSAEQLALLSRLAGGLAHEIKNPLSTMAINLTLLEEDWERAAQVAPAGQSGETAPHEPTPREARALKRVRTLKSEVQRLESILADFLGYVRGGEVNRAPRDVAQLVQEVCDFVEPENEAAGIRQHVDVQFGLPLVWIDPTQIKQALMNLFVNARQAMPEGGEILVRVQRDGNEVEVSITDTGVGMTPEQLARCFDVYWSNKKGGTGLGLATTKRIVEEHGGAIRAISDVGRGTSFAILLPLAVELTRRARPDPT